MEVALPDKLSTGPKALLRLRRLPGVRSVGSQPAQRLIVRVSAELGILSRVEPNNFPSCARS